MRALVLHGYGINCEREMAFGASLAGAEVENAHAKAWLVGQINLSDFDLLLLPGGFSFGDELGAAKAFANRITFSSRRDDLLSFIEKGKCVFGVCNGFQLLIKLGILPGWTQRGPEQRQEQRHLSGKPQAALIHNAQGAFESRWAYHKVISSHCVFTRDLQDLYLPVRHGEGNFIIDDPDRLFSEGHVVLQYADAAWQTATSYPDNPNGSSHAIAGICDKSGRVFGMMAHPEAALFFTHLPHWTRLKEYHKRRSSPLPEFGPGLVLFKNAVNYLRQA